MSGDKRKKGKGEVHTGVGRKKFSERWRGASIGNQKSSKKTTNGGEGGK